MTSTLDWMAQRISEIEQAAAEKERERIIKLLEADKCEVVNCTCGTTIKYIVALIKRKNK